MYPQLRSGPNVVLDVEPSSTVLELKGRIHTVIGISPPEQRLIFLGKLLQDAHTLHDCGISQDSTIHLTMRLRGGF
ncbi:polyubiquitin, putative [Aduncisulcus paluster]|uniref:Polyubiquitin, putative n=1 Tax=Aduncisulcus paluster TaxID=2918883 RepID=A0ABQ5K1P2_9EUKA|nr:polyubiquitin, putative [Aduncisulcus paluster]